MTNGGSGTGVGGGAPGGPGDTGAAAEGNVDGGSGGGRTDAEHTGAGYHGFQSGSYALDAAATIADTLNKAKGKNINSAPRGYRAGNPHTDTINADVAQATGWKGGQTLTDRFGQPVTLEAHENAMSLSELESLRQDAYAAKNAKTGWDVPLLGNVSTNQIAQQAMAAMGGGLVTGIGSAALGVISQPYDARVSGTAAERAALGYSGPGYPTAMPNVGPHMSEENRNWDDARWGDNFDPTVGRPAPVTRDSQGNITVQVAGGANPPTSPAGGEQITVAAPAGAPDARVTQFKALYPEDWTATLTDEEIIEMVENPDQLRFWLSWRQT